MSLVSVIIPTYHGDALRHVQDAVASILEQSHRDLELIVVKDGEISAETQDYLVETTANDDRVRVIGLERSVGPAAARNRGIEAAGGEYIAMLDADDVAAPQRLERQLAYAQGHDVPVVGCCYRVIDDAGQLRGERRVPTSPDTIRRYAALINPVGSSMLFARAEVLKNQKYDECIRYGEDYDLSIRILRAGYTVANQPEYLVDVRTGERFLARRRGWRPFRSDCSNRLKAVALAPVWFRPMILVPALVLVAGRLLPQPALRLLYAVRARMAFGQ